jgi:hypothetical protein
MNRPLRRLARWLPALGLLASFGAQAQTFRVQCPDNTTQHPNGVGSDGSAIKCQQVSGGDGYATMADGSTIYLFGFGPLSGLNDIYHGQPGTETNSTFNIPLGGYQPTDTAPTSLVGMPNGDFTYNGAIGLTQDTGVDPWLASTAYAAGAYVRTANGIYQATTAGTSAGRGSGPAGTGRAIRDGSVVWSYQNTLLDGHVDPRPIMDVGVMNASQPAPLIAIDEDDELFLTLTNVGMIMRPDLFEQHTIHFHGYPNASSFYDGVPDASVAINIGGSFSYYYLAPDAGTYFWHCHISPPEHLQMGMVGQLYVRPRQNRVKVGAPLWTALDQWETPAASTLPANPSTPAQWTAYEAFRKRCGTDVLCTTPIPASNNATRAATGGYAYNDGDGSTYFDVEYPIQMHGFDPNFHFVGMTFNPESFKNMKDKYFLLNGRSYPDTIGGHTCVQGDPLAACANVTVGSVVAGPMETQSTDGTYHASQPLPTIINIPCPAKDNNGNCKGGRALLRISDLDVTEEETLATMGIPMLVVGYNARLLRDMGGNNTAYKTNSVTLGGGESVDVILDATGAKVGQKFYLYSPNLDHLSNDAENFGGMMTEINICTSVDPKTKACAI